MIVEYIRYAIGEDRRSAFEQAYATAAASLDTSPHCVGYELSHGHEEPDHYILRIEWDSLEGHERGFRSSAEFGPFFQAIGPYVGDIREMRHYRVTNVKSS